MVSVAAKALAVCPADTGAAAALPERAGLADREVCVAGLGITGRSVIAMLAGLGARVTAVDSRDDTELREIAAGLAEGGVQVAELCRVLPNVLG